MTDPRVMAAGEALGAYLKVADQGDEQPLEAYLERRGDLATDLLWDLVQRCPVEVQIAIRARQGDHG